MPDAARPRAGRTPIALAAAVVTAAGLTVAALGSGAIADAAGDALYAVLVYLVLVFWAPGQRRAVLAAVAFGVCALIELAQLTGGPAALVELWGPARYLLGTTFNAVDLVAYAGGAAAGAALHTALTPEVTAPEITPPEITPPEITPCSAGRPPPR